MKNPKKWAGATPYEHDGLNDHSSSGRSEGSATNSRGHKHAVKSWKATPQSHFKPTPNSEALDAIPGATKTHPMLAQKSFEAGPPYGPGSKMVPTPTSGAKTLSADGKESLPKSWKKRGYDMAGGHGVAAENIGTARKKPK